MTSPRNEFVRGKTAGSFGLQHLCLHPNLSRRKIINLLFLLGEIRCIESAASIQIPAMYLGLHVKNKKSHQGD